MNITLKPIGEKTRSIASLQGIQKPDELDDLMLVSIVPQIGKCISTMGGRMQFAPTITGYRNKIGYTGKIYPEHLILNQDLQDYLNNECHKKGVIFLSTSQWH